jgi:hypothetical protein
LWTISDLTRPRVVTQLQTPAGTHSHKVLVVGDVLLVNHERSAFEPHAPDWSAGLKVYDVSTPASRVRSASCRRPARVCTA